nr:MAG TPA: hypothetical protein [Caudoviricetes sp.]
MLNITKPIWNELANGIQKRCNTVEILIGGGGYQQRGMLGYIGVLYQDIYNINFPNPKNKIKKSLYIFKII